MPVISALNLILSAHPSRPSTESVMVGRNKFFHYDANEPPAELGGGLQAWRGFYSSVRPAHRQLMVNVNVCTPAFYTPGNLAEQWQDFEYASKGGRPNAFCKGIRVKTIHLGYVKTIKTVTNVTARNHKFHSEEFGEVSVMDYFKKSKPSLSCIIVSYMLISTCQSTTSP